MAFKVARENGKLVVFCDCDFTGSYKHKLVDSRSTKNGKWHCRNCNRYFSDYQVYKKLNLKYKFQFRYWFGHIYSPRWYVKNLVKEVKNETTK